MIARGLPIYVALEPVDMRLGFEKLGAIVRERMAREPFRRPVESLQTPLLRGSTGHRPRALRASTGLG